MLGDMFTVSRVMMVFLVWKYVQYLSACDRRSTIHGLSILCSSKCSLALGVGKSRTSFNTAQKLMDQVDTNSIDLADISYLLSCVQLCL